MVEDETGATDEGVVQVLDSLLHGTKAVQVFGLLSKCCLVLEAHNTEGPLEVEYTPGRTNKSMAVCMM